MASNALSHSDNGESLKIAVTAWDLNRTEALAQVPEQAVIAERMGFSGFWLPENHFAGPAALSAPLILLAGAASRTQTIDLGTTSLVLPIRHPVSVAEEVATLDQLCGGRLILGLGRGFSNDLFEVFGVDPKQKRTLFKAALNRMIALWQGETVGNSNERNIYVSPAPHQSPYPRIWIAAFGPLALKQAAAFGCPYLASPMESFGELKQNLEIYHAALSETQNVIPDCVPIMRTIFITHDVGRADAVSAQLSLEHQQRSTEQPRNDPPFLVGTPQAVKDQLTRYKDELGMNYLVARGRIKGVSNEEQLDSHARLLDLAL